MYTNNRNAYREVFFNAWQKYQKKLPLSATEMQVIEVILQHPEYHLLLDKPGQYQEQEFALEENPFFHMSLHLAIRDQIKINRPAGIDLVKQELTAMHVDNHHVEHLMMNILFQMITLSQQTGTFPDDEVYLSRLRETLS